MISQLRSIGIAVALLAGAAAAQASLTVYSGVRNSGPIGTVDGTPKTARDNFVAALTSVGSENFDSFANFAPSSSTTLNINFSGSAGGITGSLTGDQMFVVSDTLAQVGGASPTGRFDTTGTGASSDVRKYLEVADSFTLTFSAAVSAFGVYGTDIGDFGGSLDVILTDSSGGQTTRSIQDNNAGGAADGGLMFWGFVDTTKTYTSLQFVVSQGDSLDGFGFDDMMVGSLRTTQPPTVPEPMSALLALAALAAAGAARRARR